MSLIDLSPFNDILARLEGVANRLERGVGAAPVGSGAGAAAAAPAAPAAEDCAIAQAFDAFLQQQLPPLETACKEIGSQDVQEATDMYIEGLRLLRQLLAATGICKKPQDTDWAKILGAVMELGGKAQKACDNRSDFFQNRKAAAEALNVITLVTSNSPAGHVQNVIETMDFHATKVMLKKIDKETAWAKAFKEVNKELKNWCTENCKMGVIWNANGKAAMEYFDANPLGSGSKGSDAPKPAKGKGKGPAPPKGGFSKPPPELFEGMKAEAKASAPAGGMAAVFAAIGNADTSKLKKVTDDMKTHKQPLNQREHGPITAAAPKAAAPKAAAAGGGLRKGPRGAPIKELQRDVNWMVENFENEPNLTLDNVDKTQLVCVINCKNVTVRINEKVKNICVDGCEKVNVICADVVSSVELVNSDRCQIQTTGKVHSFAIDKCNGANIFLSKESLGAEFVTSKSSEMNVTIPDGDEGDIIEMPIPEQFVTKLDGKKLKTEVSSLYS
eukprot:TRINITY_DN109307_c0_g1_i1.p1 TRINITY_DN109307_c0_g1~~TRINITY_DN109307_c0_g1_i1.p1  ORF type:complete len:501 (+),score=165.84 TRINITY_DN109307_c0_g1_i1:86-1588(+)